MRRQPLEIASVTPGQENAACIGIELQTALDDLFGHQRGDLDADVDDLPCEFRLAEADEQLLQPPAGEVAGDKDQPLSHGPAERPAAALAGG